MRTRSIVIALTAVATATAVIGVLAVVAVVNPGHGRVPMTPPPSVSAPGPTQPSASAGPGMTDIRGAVVHIEIRHGAAALAEADVTTVALDSDGVLAPPRGRAGVYYSPTEWSTLPGNLDRYRGIIVGHDVTGTGAKDVFYDLGRVRAGDLVTLTYRLDGGGTATAEFEAIADARSAPKTDVIHSPAYRYLWQAADPPGRRLSILSCDLATADPGRHSRNNWIVDADRIR
jgi:hypothetical protein